MSLKALQQKIGVTADGAWGPGTLRAAAAFYKLPPTRAAHFFGQTSHETGGFKAFSENLNYNAKGLMGIFKKYFPDTATAAKYERKPEAIANRVYASRMGNGNEASGEGFKFRGRGYIQLTGKENYVKFGKFIGEDIVFFRKMKAAGIPLHAHTGALVKHIKRFSLDFDYYALYWTMDQIKKQTEQKQKET